MVLPPRLKFLIVICGAESDFGFVSYDSAETKREQKEIPPVPFDACIQKGSLSFGELEPCPCGFLAIFFTLF
jgi:hypothetical protein